MDKMLIQPFVVNKTNSPSSLTLPTKLENAHPVNDDLNPQEVFSFIVGVCVVGLFLFWLSFCLFKRRLRIVYAFKVLLGLTEIVENIGDADTVGISILADDEEEQEEDENEQVADFPHNRKMVTGDKEQVADFPQNRIMVTGDTIATADVQDVRDVITYYRQFENPLATFRENQQKALQMEEERVREEKHTKSPAVKRWTPNFLGK